MYNPTNDEENSLDCLKLTKSIQRAADTLQSVADTYEDHARRTQLITHEALKAVSHPHTLYAVCLSSPSKGRPNGRLMDFLAYY